MPNDAVDQKQQPLVNGQYMTHQGLFELKQNIKVFHQVRILYMPAQFQGHLQGNQVTTKPRTVIAFLYFLQGLLIYFWNQDWVFAAAGHGSKEDKGTLYIDVLLISTGSPCTPACPHSLSCRRKGLSQQVHTLKFPPSL